MGGRRRAPRAGRRARSGRHRPGGGAGTRRHRRRRLNTFASDLWPTLAVATGDSAIGPDDDVPGVAPTSYELAGDVVSGSSQAILQREDNLS